ncbi:MAG: efflux RND transporter permease subunit, partial [Cyanobacteria bacterium]|nr:efflux RND transporter permease subunit [Cyanobacteriota bacterium]
MNSIIDSVIQLSFRHRWITTLFACLLIAGGIFAFKTLDTEAYPEFTPPQVRVITILSGKGAEEVERLVTTPLEKELNGIPGLTNIRSTSIFGLSVIILNFADDTVMAVDRQRVLERINQADIPSSAKPTLSPESGAVGEIYRYTVESSHYNPMSRKAVEDWQLERAFRAIPGVIDVTSFGGPIRTYQVNVDPNRLIAENVTLDQVYQALTNSNSSTGGNYIEYDKEAYIVRGISLLKNIDDINNVVVSSTQNGTPIRVREVAKVDIGPGVRLGQFGKNLEDDAVLGIVLMRRGENPARVIHELYKKFPEIQKALPDGIHLVPLYDRNSLIEQTLETIGHNVLEGVGLVLLILIIFLADFTSGLVTATVIPLALFFAFICLKVFGIPANLLSLGAIDFGIIVDGAVVMVENAFSRLSGEHLSAYESNDTRAGRMNIVLNCAKQVGKPILFATIVIITAFIPIFAFDGVAGKLFRPLAFTMNFALIGAVLVGLTIIPVLIGFFLTRKKLVHRESIIIKYARKIYGPTLRWTLRKPAPMITIASLGLLMALFLFSQTGSEFLPQLEEGNIWLRATVQPPSVSLEESVKVAHKIRYIIRNYPEVKNVTTQSGSPDDGTDPNLFSNIECLIDLKPASQWRSQFHENKQLLIASMEKDLSEIDNVLLNFSQYIQDNVDEAISGAKGNVGIKIYGPDLNTLQSLGDQVSKIVKTVPGMVDVANNKLIGQPQYQIFIDRDQANRYNINASDIQKLVEVAIGGRVATQVVDGEKRFNLLVRLGKQYR